MGISKRDNFRQRAAGWCEAAERSAEIPPGVAFLKRSAVGKDGDRPIQREVLLDTVRG